MNFVDSSYSLLFLSMVNLYLNQSKQVQESSLS